MVFGETKIQKIYFNEDGTYISKWDNGDLKKGKWWINENKKIEFSNLTEMSILNISNNHIKYSQGGNIYNAEKIK